MAGDRPSRQQGRAPRGYLRNIKDFRWLAGCARLGCDPDVSSSALPRSAPARNDLETLMAEGASRFGFTTSARDDTGRKFIEYHAGFIEWLDATYQKVAQTPDYVVYHLRSPATPNPD
jgi:hypothetical protein